MLTLLPWSAQLLINGKFEDATDGGTFETYDPRTGEPLMSVAEATAEDVDRAVRAARNVRALEPPSMCTCMLLPVAGEPQWVRVHVGAQAFDNGPWPRMGGRQRGVLMNKLADLMQV